MDIKRSLKVRDDAISRLKDAYYWVERQHMEASYAEDYIAHALNRDEAYRRAPQWVRSYVEGYQRALRDDLWRNKIVWRQQTHDGRWIDGKTVHENYTTIIDVNTPGAFFWKDRDPADQLTTRPAYFTLPTPHTDTTYPEHEGLAQIALRNHPTNPVSDQPKHFEPPAPYTPTPPQPKLPGKDFSPGIRQLTKTQARKLYNAYPDLTIYFCASNLMPFTMHHWQYETTKSEQQEANYGEPYSFDGICANFAYHNCDSEMGRYIHFYVRTNDYLHQLKQAAQEGNTDAA